MASALETARSLLADATPLRRDCGALCGALCCQDDGEEDLGMLLFPGEEALYGEDDASWMHIVPSEVEYRGAAVPLLVCDGVCPRDRRPLACRMFPLGPSAGEKGVSVRVDARSRFLCPLYDSGIRGLLPAFVTATEQALSALWADEAQREYLIWLSALIDEYADMLREFRKR